MEPDNKTVIGGDRADDMRQDRLWFLESMDQINRAIQDTDDFGQVSHVLDAVLGIFGSDRAWIPHVRLKIGGQIYERTLSLVSDPDEKAAVLQAKWKKYPQWKVPSVSTATVFRVLPE